MRCDDESTWEIDWFDDILKEFGPGAYIEARYAQMESEVKEHEAILGYSLGDLERTGAGAPGGSGESV